MKEQYIHIRVSEEEKSQLEKLAQDLGLTTSAYIRMMIVKEFNKTYNKEA